MSFSKTILSILLGSVLGTMPPAPAAGIHGRGSFSYEGPVSAPDPNIDGCSYTEILGKENLRPVLFRTHLAVIALSAARWQSFFIAHPKATRQEIEDFKLSLEK